MAANCCKLGIASKFIKKKDQTPESLFWSTVLTTGHINYITNRLSPKSRNLDVSTSEDLMNLSVSSLVLILQIVEDILDL